jgi:uncharacterized protein (TIGR02611 family)
MPGSARMSAIRAAVRRWPGGWLIWRIGVTLVGLIVVLVGVVLIPLPGPGWLIVFLGLGIWSTEYAWARRLTQGVRLLINRWWHWLGAQPRWVQAGIAVLGIAFMAVIVLGGWYLLH